MSMLTLICCLTLGRRLNTEIEEYIMENLINVPVINDNPTKKESDAMFYGLMSRESDMDILHNNSPEHIKKRSAKKRIFS